MLPIASTSPTSPSPAQRSVHRGDEPPIHLQLDPEARFFLWIDPRGFSQGSERPRPSLVLILARSSAISGEPSPEDRAALEHFLGLTQLERQYAWPGAPTFEDVHWIGREARSFLAPNHDDLRAPELVLIAYGPGLEERSRQRIGPGPGVKAPPPAFDRRLALRLVAEELPRGAWIDTPGLLEKVQANLQIRDRWLLAPGAEGSVRWWGTSVTTRAPAADLHFRGSPEVYARVSFPPELFTLASLLAAPVQIERASPGGERCLEERSAIELCFGERPLPSCCGAPLLPFCDQPLVEGPHFGLERHAGADGEVLVVRLHQVLEAAAGESILGWSLDVGFRDELGFEPWSRQRFKCGGRSSGAQALTAILAKGRHGTLELIVRNAEGLPLHRRSFVL